MIPTPAHAKHATALALALAAGLFGAAQAPAGIIQNGDFETGSLSAWTATGDVGLAPVPFFGEGSTAAEWHIHGFLRLFVTPATEVGMVVDPTSAFDEIQQLRVDAILQGRAHAVRRALIDNELRVFHDLR